MRVLWISGLPMAVQQEALGGVNHGAQADWSWIVAHLPPPPEIELHIAALWPGGSAQKTVEFQGARFHLIPCPARGRALLLFARDRRFFQPLHEELKPSVVHGWGTEDSFSLVARRLAPTRHVIGIQGLITAYRRRIPMPTRSILTQITERITLRRARCVVAESRYSADIARPLCPQASIRVIEHPLRDEFMHSPAATGMDRQVLFLGRVDERKGISDAMLSFAAASDASWKLRVIGSGDPAEISGMRRLADQLDLGDRFRHEQGLLPGEIARIMGQSSIFLLPTRIDTGPTALKEALAMGLWPVCYDNSGPAEYIRLAKFGTLAADGNRTDLTSKLQQALQEKPWLDRARRTALGEFSKARFSKRTIWGELIRLYNEVPATAA